MQPSRSLPLDSFEDRQKFKVHPGDASDDITGHRAGAWSLRAGPVSAVPAPGLCTAPDSTWSTTGCCVLSDKSLSLSGLKVKSLFQRRMLCFCPELSGHTCWFLWFANGRVCEAPWAGLLELNEADGQRSQTPEATGTATQPRGLQWPLLCPCLKLVSRVPEYFRALATGPTSQHVRESWDTGRGAHATEGSSSPIYRCGN